MNRRTLDIQDYAHLVVDGDWAPAFDAMYADANDIFAQRRSQVLDYRGEYMVKRPVSVGADRSVILAGSVEAAQEFAGPVLKIEGDYSYHQGFWYVYGIGSTNYKQRKNETAVLVGDCQSTVCTGFELLRFTHGALESDPTKNSIGFHAGIVHCRDIGSAAGTPENVAALNLAFVNRVDEGSHSSTLQHSRLGIDPADLEWLPHARPDTTVFIAGQPYNIKAVDLAQEEILVFPKLRDSATVSGTATLSHGAGFGSIGGNTSGMSAHTVVGLRVGELVKYGSYLGWIDQVIVDRGCGVGIRNNQPSGIALGGGIGYLHCEVDGIGMQVLDVSRPEEGLTVCSTVAFDGALWQGLAPVRPDHGPQNGTWTALQGFAVFDRGALITAGRAAEVAGGKFPGIATASTHPARNYGVLRDKEPAVELFAEPGMEESWVKTDLWLVCVGEDGQPPEKLTLSSSILDGPVVHPFTGEQSQVCVIHLPGRVMAHVYREKGVWRVSLLPFSLAEVP